MSFRKMTVITLSVCMIAACTLLSGCGSKSDDAADTSSDSAQVEETAEKEDAEEKAEEKVEEEVKEEAEEISAEENEIVGTYELTEMYDPDDEEGTSTEDIAALKQLGLYALMEMKNDGTGSMYLFGETLDLVWDENGITMSEDGDMSEAAQYSFENGKLVMTDDSDGSSLTFEKISQEEYDTMMSEAVDISDLDADE